MRRPDTARTAVVDMSADELDIFNRLKVAGAFDSDQNVLRSALWNLADDMQIDMPNGVFDQRKRPGGQRGPRKGWVHAPAPKLDKRTLPRRQRPTGAHPWRGPDGLVS